MNEFNEVIWTEGRKLYRQMPWREDTRPYYVLVSELMLQQTQVARVIPKFMAFVEAFPDEATLAKASLADVLKLWQGLGYNRRAKFLHESAKRIVNDFDGVFPTEHADILSLPGVGKNTCGAIEAYAFNRPSLFIETNVRTVYIRHFFADDFEVDDKWILEKLTTTIDTEHPREFYWSLMDYGSWLKANGVRNSARSKHYKKQSPLEGSLRQVRGQIIRELTTGAMTEATLRQLLKADYRFESALAGLQRDGLVSGSPAGFHLTK
ncbi:MAG: A/G-specific adenine glycosylase [Patescibacteria group bacterium]